MNSGFNLFEAKMANNRELYGHAVCMQGSPYTGRFW